MLEVIEYQGIHDVEDAQGHHNYYQLAFKLVLAPDADEACVNDAAEAIAQTIADALLNGKISGDE